MRLHEYQTKSVFRKNHIPIPYGKVAPLSGEVKQIAEEINGPVLVKAQVLVGGRSHAGGIRLAKSPGETVSITSAMLGMNIKGYPVNKVLIEKSISYTKEIFLAITLDHQTGTPILVSSGSGGVDIEEVARDTPEKIFSIHIDPHIGLQEYQARMVAINMDLPQEFRKEFIRILKNFWQIFVKYDAILVEMNPLVITTDNQLLALDAKLIIDDNALYRQEEIADTRWLEAETLEILEARKFGLSYVPMNGNIGCLANGGGLAMATTDAIQYYGGKPANFIDMGGGANIEKAAAAIRILLSDPQVKVMLINIYGGMTRCDDIAKGILETLSNNERKKPIVIRLNGTNAKEANAMLESQNLYIVSAFTQAIQKAIEIAGSNHDESAD